MSNTNRKQSLGKNKLELVFVKEKNNKQRDFLNAPGHIVGHGVAGTGKTFLALYKAFKLVEEEKFSSVTLIRSAVATRDMGFLPGTEKDKAEVYEAAYRDNASKLFGRGDAYEILKSKKLVNFITTSFLRGITLDDTIIIVDECQNMTYHELDTIMTRIGENCLVIFCGDWRQSDLKNNGIVDFYKVLKDMHEFTFIEFELKDIVRSDLVKNYLTKKLEILGDEGYNK